MNPGKKKPTKKKETRAGLGCTHISPEEAKRPPKKGKKK